MERPSAVRKRLVQAQEFESGACQKALLDYGRKVAQRLDQPAGLRLAQRERVVRAKGDALGTDQADQVAQRIGVVDQRVQVELAEVFARAAGVVDGAQVGPGVEAVL